MDTHGCATDPWRDVRVRCSTRSDGDFHRDLPLLQLERTRRRFVDLPWSQPDEVHGTHVAVVTRPGEHDGAVADAVVTDCAGAVLGIWVGDCAPVAFVGAQGRIGAAHAGWRGLLDGVLAVTVRAMRDQVDDPTVTALLGPCIHPCCYEFGSDDLRRVADRFGAGVRGVTVDGRPALDVPAAVTTALAELDVPVAAVDAVSGGTVGGTGPACTGCRADRWFSHRARRERGRQVMAVWKDPR